MRRPVPGGIGTYIRGLQKGLRELGEVAPRVTLWHGRLPPRVTTWAWDHGLGGPPANAGDIVHAASFAIPPHGGRPLAVMVHDLAWRRLPDAYPERGRGWHEAALQRALGEADLFLVPSRATADDLLSAGADPALVKIVEEGCDHLDPPDHEAAAALLARLGVPGHFLLTVSTLEPRKNLARLVTAFGVARPRLPEPSMALLVVGPTGWGPAVAPGDGVVLAGPTPGGTLSALYGMARAFVYVPLFEGFGLPAVEAMACGTPVVASPIPSTGGAALEVDPLDVESIAEGLVRAAAEGEERYLYVASGRARARALTWRSTASGHVQAWETLE